MRKFQIIFFFLLAGLPAFAQAVPRASDFSVVCDSLTARCNRRFRVVSSVNLTKVYLRNDVLDLYFGSSLADYPWHRDDVIWFLNELNTEAKDILQGHLVGSCRASGRRLEELQTPELTRNGKSPEFIYKVKNTARIPLVRRQDAKRISKGLSGRHIALWQSHGYYYNENQDAWRWQRATLHRTVEDMYTPSYVLDYLIPMLENAGAYVMTPRERDVQHFEVICDNDSTFVRSGAPLVRSAGKFEETGLWEDSGYEGFADLKESYEITDNPFRSGTSLTSWCSVTPSNSVRWTPDIPVRGEYAVYVSYTSHRNSNKSAHYSVHHLGGVTDFLVDQSKAGGTWVYIGTFDFAPGTGGYVELDNKGNAGEIVSADAVRFGGGMGKVSRGGRISGLPSFCEGASYWMPWAGADSTLRAWDTDYTNDYATRGAWTRMMRKEKGVPFDCSFAFHTDAGVTPNDSIVGTLAIYTLKNEDTDKFSDGGDRLTSRTYADFVQTQIVEDLRTGFEPKWSRRQLWDRSYSESRTTDVPAMLLELLSHQNFADMKYGLDPSFRFNVGRAVYKGILKYLACRYGVQYAVQPLPVHAFAAELSDSSEVRLSWKATPDVLEATAAPKGYTVYTRIDDGAFDEGVSVADCEAAMQIEPGHLYSYKVVAWNDGGSSFPSEVLSAGIPLRKRGGPVLIVNNFDRVAAPSWVDTPEYAGFESRLDDGMPYVRDITYIGENYEFHRPLKWESDDAPGFGGSFCDKAGEVVAGNTFDYPSVHGASIMNLGFPFCSMSSEAFCADTALVTKYSALDLVCGAQVTTKSGRGVFPDRFKVFSDDMQAALTRWSGKGGNILISGSRIATDVWSQVYDIKVDSLGREKAKVFVKDTFGYKWASSYGTNTGELAGMPFYSEKNSERYAVPYPDGLTNADSRSSVWLRYNSSGVPAAVKFNSGHHKTVSLGVPLECLMLEFDRERVMREAFEFFGMYGPADVPGSYQYSFLYFTPYDVKYPWS